MASLLLVPYDDSMRIGQGYNSFLQSPCVYDAVNIAYEDEDSDDSSVSQIVSYSSRFVNKISEVLKPMNMSPGTAIKRGSLTLSGNNVTLDELKFSGSDLNAVISVNVMNQQTKIRDASIFNTPPYKLNNQEFRKQYGDCYISGFVEGGELHGIVSIKVLESSKKQEIVSQLKKVLNNSETSEFTLSKTGSQSTISSILRQTETSITVNYSGGGSIKPESTSWSLETLLKAAAMFPSKVATCPKRTYAILTQYDCNIHFRAYAEKNNLVMPEYTLAQSYVADLLDSYMGWKHTLAVIQDVLLHPSGYTESRNAFAIPVDIPSLVETRNKVKKNMNLIVREIDKLFVLFYSDTGFFFSRYNRRDANPTTAPSNSQIESPEVFKTRLPVHKTDGHSEMEMATSELKELFARFPFRAQTPAAQEPSTGTKSIPSDDSPPFEAKWFKDRESDPQLSKFPYGRARGKLPPTTTFDDRDFFESTSDLLKLSKVDYWPYRFAMVASVDDQGRHDLVRMENSYGTPTASVTVTHGKRTEVAPTLIELKKDEWVTSAKIGLGEVDGISGVQLGTNKDNAYTVGQIGAKSFDYVPPEGAKGLKGFFGWKRDVIYRLGPIWG